MKTIQFDLFTIEYSYYDSTCGVWFCSLYTDSEFKRPYRSLFAIEIGEDISIDLFWFKFYIRRSNKENCDG